MKNVQGNCLCGEFKVRIKEIETNVVACHCSMCRKQAAGPMLFTHAVTPENRLVESEETLTVYDSSNIASRGFCSKCGTLIFYKNKESGEESFNAELFDELSKQATLEKEVYLKDKPSYYSFANEIEKV